MSDGNRHGANERDGKRKSCERLEVPDVAVPGKNLQALAGLPEPPEPGFTTKEAPLPPCSGCKCHPSTSCLSLGRACPSPKSLTASPACYSACPFARVLAGVGSRQQQAGAPASSRNAPERDLKTEEAVAAAQREAGDANILTQQQEPIDGSSLLESLICKPGPDETNENRAESLSTSAQDETAEPGRPSKASPMIEEL
eukprot:scaffold1618_cov397-Prasinococcus_capsulatus_cf.AAC.17